jgi:hypothetical protein
VPSFTALLAIIDLIDNDLPRFRSATDIKAALIIWRKTHGWGLTAEEIGAAELAQRAGTDKDVMKKRLSAVCTAIGIRVEARSAPTRNGGTVHLRTRYHWPINQRVEEILRKAAGTLGSVRPPGSGASDPHPGEPATPTQLHIESIDTEQLGVEEALPEENLEDERRPAAQPAAQSGPSDVHVDTSEPCPPSAGMSQEVEWMRDAMGAYGRRRTMREHTGEEPPPAVALNCLIAAEGIPLREVGEILRHKCFVLGLDPGSKYGPRGWGWFPAVIANELKKRRGSTWQPNLQPSPPRICHSPARRPERSGLARFEIGDLERAI